MCQWFTNQNAYVYIKQFNIVKKLVKIPTQKGEHSYKCTELSLKVKEGISCFHCESIE